MGTDDKHVQQAHRSGCSHGPAVAGLPCFGQRHGRRSGSAFAAATADTAGRLQQRAPRSWLQCSIHHPPSSIRAGCASGFTLIELLLVVAIIALLIGLLLAGIAKARRQAEFQRARVEVQSLYNAFQSYYADYARYPYTDEAAHAVDSTLVGMLSGGSDLGNTKQRVYLPIRTGQTNSAGAVVDPWGTSYRVLFDGTGSAADGLLANPFGPAGSSNRVPVMVWSYGPDGQTDTDGEMSARNKDNIRSY